MEINKILKITRSYKGAFNERIATWLFKRYVKANAYEGITWFNEEEISIYFSSREYIERTVWMLGEYETEVNKVFQAYVNKNSTVLDIGANIGINTIRLSKLVGEKGLVYSFEPIPFNQNRFEKNILLNKIQNVQLQKFALGARNEKLFIDFNDKEENMGAVNLRNEKTGGLPIEVKIGDDWIQEMNIPKVDFMKIDVEGFESNVINGLAKTITRDHPTILLEWDRNYLKESGNSVSLWQRFMEVNAYKIFQINRYSLTPVSKVELANDGNLLLV